MDIKALIPNGTLFKQYLAQLESKPEDKLTLNNMFL